MMDDVLRGRDEQYSAILGLPVKSAFQRSRNLFPMCHPCRPRIGLLKAALMSGYLSVQDGAARDIEYTALQAFFVIAWREKFRGSN